MTIIGIDDTDSRTKGMCTTYVGHRIKSKLEDNGHNVERILLVRLNPSAKHKTRGNASVAIHTDAKPKEAYEISTGYVSDLSVEDEKDTNPAVVVSPTDKIDESVQEFTLKVIRELCDISEAEELIENNNYLSFHLGNGRGRIGSLAAIGAWSAIDDWTYECISYRNQENRGTERMVDIDSVFDSADELYPSVWDTVDRRLGAPVCIPNAPGPILYGIRGDYEDSVENLTSMIQDEEPVESMETFMTNQGTDIHIQETEYIEDVENNSAYNIKGEVVKEPETKEGGHVFFSIKDDSGSIDAVAFEPTKHFRNIVRSLRVGDVVELQGEVSQGTIKIEKMRVHSLNNTKLSNPKCSDCGRSMSSAGRNQGYRCRDCGNHQDSKVKVEIDRDIDVGWYEVPPCARRHISKPLIRGGFEGETHPFK